MPDEEQVDAAKAAADEIKSQEKTDAQPHGNVWSEPEDGSPELPAPPPFSA